MVGRQSTVAEAESDASDGKPIMKVSCPQCHLKGLIDAGELTAETRIYCVQCGAAYDVIFFDGKIETFLLPENPDPPFPQVFSDNEDAKTMNTDPHSAPNRYDSDNILVLPSNTHFNYEMNTQAPVLEEVFPLSIADLSSPAPQQLTTARIADEPESALSATSGSGLGAQHEPAATPVQPTALFAPENRESESVRKARNSSAERDKYGLGVQLLRVSPVWLLTGGFAFVCFITLCNWLMKPGAQAHNVAPRPAALNQASNKSVASSTAATNPAPAKNQASNRSTATDATSAQAVPQENAKPAAVATMPVSPVETKVETEATAVASVPKESAKGGGLTIQIGSYNDMAQANAKVESLKAAGFEGRVATAEIPKRGTWYRVQVGRFADRDEAARYGAQMRAKGAAESVIVTEVQK